MYDARKEEVLELLDESVYPDDAKEEMRDVLESYFREREGRLDNLVHLLEPSDEPCHKDWIAKAQEAAGRAHDALKESKVGRLWMAKVANQEHTFFFKLMTSGVAARRDRMVRQTKDLGKAEKEFESKWSTIKGSDNDVDKQMKKVSEQYTKLLNEAVKIASKIEKESKERMADLIAKLLAAGFIGVDFGIVEEILKGGARAISTKLDQSEARRYELHALFSREEGIYATFEEARDVVKEFLEETGYPRIKDTWDDAEDLAEKLPGAMLTEGQKDDAKELEKELKNQLQKVFSVAEKAYKGFAKKHEYLFFGPLGGQYYAELGEDDYWKSKSREWQNSKRDIDDLLRDRFLNASEREILDVSLSGLEGEDARRVYYRLSRHCQDVLQAWNKFKEFHNDPYFALESREDTKSILDAMR